MSSFSIDGGGQIPRQLVLAILVVAMIVAPPTLAEASGPQKAQKAQKPDKPGNGGGGGGNGGGGGGATGELPASLLLDELDGDKVLGDGGTFYLDGVSGVASTVDGGSEYDLTLGSKRKTADRSVLYVFDALVRAGSCSGNQCSCDALVQSGSAGYSSALGYLRVNLEPDAALCSMAFGASGTGRATALVGGCRVTWNPAAPGAPATLDGVTVTRTGADSWTVRTNGNGHAWLWSEGKRGTRVDEGVFSMPFGGTVAITSGACQ